MTDDRLGLATSLLQEAVYQSRARQANQVAFVPEKPDGALDRPPGLGCGLGNETAVDLDLTPRGAELVHELWPDVLTPSRLERIRNVMRDWVESQDALDRKRNHFLRDFRQANGFDRRAYSAEQAQAFEGGLEQINAEIEDRLRQAAEALLATE